jgi:hypothetical protein
MFDNQVSRYYPALNSTRETSILSDLYVPDRIDRINEYPQDFFQYIATDWTVTGAGTAALIAGAGGVLQLTTTASTFESVQKTPAAWQMVKGLRAWYVSQVNIDSLLGVMIDGLLNATATPFTGASQTDGMYFLSTVTTGALTFNVAVGGVITSVACGTSLVPGAAANANLNFYYDGACYAGAPLGRVVWEAWGPGVTSNVRGEIAIPASGTIAAFPGTTFISPIFGVNATTAAVRLGVIDKLYVAQDEVNINATPAF